MAGGGRGAFFTSGAEPTTFHRCEGGNGNIFIMAGFGASTWFFFYSCMCVCVRASERERPLFSFFFKHFLHVSICNSLFRSDTSFVWH